MGRILVSAQFPKLMLPHLAGRGRNPSHTRSDNCDVPESRDCEAESPVLDLVRQGLGLGRQQG